MSRIYQVTYHAGTVRGTYIDGPVCRNLRTALASIAEMVDFCINNDPLTDATVTDAETGEVIMAVNMRP